MRKTFVIATLALVACDSGQTVDNGDMASPPDMATAFPALLPPAPQVVNAGGDVLAAPVWIPVSFSNDDAGQVSQLNDFLSKLGPTQYWAATTAEYGVGPGSSTAPVALTETATGTLDDSDIQTWLANKLNANDPAFPAPTDNSIYVLNYPGEVTITLGGATGQTSCQQFGAYHSNIILDLVHLQRQVAYAVIPRCAGQGSHNSINITTASTAHELIEAATDPYPQTSPAYASVDPDHRTWSRVNGGSEVADLCAQQQGAFVTLPELPYLVQRSWSNAAAAAGHDPCVPQPSSDVYFNTAPELTDDISITSFGGQMLTVKGVHVPLGTSKTIALDLFSDADTGGPWTVSVVDLTTLTGTSTTPAFNLTLDKTTGQNGDKIQLTIETLSVSTRGTGNFAVISKLGTKTNYWYGLVGEK